MIRKKIFRFALIFTVFSFNLLSQEAEKKEKQTLPLKHEIIVTATRIDTPTKEIASSVTVITQEYLDRLKKNTVLEALQEILGVAIIQNGPIGGAASVFIRGANSEHTLVMMDGVELNDPITPSRSYDLAHLSLDSVDRIEILRGPQSTLYGSDALGGIINIITKKGQGDPSFCLTGLGGSYGTATGSAEASGGTEKIHYSLAASYFRSTGFSAASTLYEGNKEKDGYRNLTLSGRFGFRLSDNLDFDFIVRNISTKIDIDSFGGAYGDDMNNIQDYDTLFFKGQIKGLFLKNRWEQKMSISLVDHFRKYDNPTDEDHPFDSDNSEYKSKLWKLDWQHNLFLHETNTFTFGMEYQREQGESEYNSEGFWGPFSSIFPHQKARTTGVYVQDQIRIANRFFATVGVRLDNQSQFETAFTYRLAPAYFIEKTGTKLKATYGTGFKSPSLYQLYAPGTFWGPIGNENLEPEKSIGWDLGIEQQFLKEKILLGATYFSNDYRNLIFFNFIQGFINITKAQSQGIELVARANITDDLLLNINYTRTEAKDKDTDTYLFRRPKDNFSATLNYIFIEKGNLSLSLIHIGDRDDQDFATFPSSRVTLPSYTLFNAVVSYEFIQDTQFFLRLDNIFDKEYELIKGYAAPSFSFYTGVKVQF